jgi:hypothetical protein
MHFQKEKIIRNILNLWLVGSIRDFTWSTRIYPKMLAFQVFFFKSNDIVLEKIK